MHIVSGFLGTGKTTALRAQLEARAGERIAVVVNDFGEAALDREALAGSEPFRIVDIPGGCVCCTAPEGFGAALAALVESAPDRLFIEPTGLARPQDLVDTIRRSPQRDRLALGPVVVLVDPQRIGRERGPEREVVAHQLEAADVLVANRIDLCSPDDLARFDAWAESLWPPPMRVHRTRHGRLPPELLEWPGDEGERLPRSASPRVGPVHGAHAHAPSTAGFAARSWRWSPERVFARSRLESAVQRLAAGEAGAPLVRLKGIFRTREGVLRLEVAGDSVHVGPSAHRRDSRADAIFGAAAEAALDRAAEALEGAVLSDEELAARSDAIELVLPDGEARVVDRAWLAALPGAVEDVSTLFPKRAGEAARLESVWRALGLPGSGTAVVCAADGLASEPLPVRALRQGVLLHSVAGAPLPAQQGGPFRLLIPEDVPDAPPGCANVKGVVRIVVREGEGDRLGAA